MQVVSGRANVHHLAAVDGHLARAFGLNCLIRREHLLILIRAKIVILEFIVKFVVTVILKLPENEAEEDTHIGVVM